MNVAPEATNKREITGPRNPHFPSTVMPGSAAYAVEVHAGEGMAIVDVIVNLRYAVVLLVDANQTQDHTAWVRSVVCWEKRFTSTGSVIGALNRTILVEACNVRAKQCHIRKPDSIASIHKAGACVGRG